MLLFAGLVWKWRYISIGSITCATTIPILIAFFRSDSQAYFIVSVIVAALILYRHQGNISRLIQGQKASGRLNPHGAGTQQVLPNQIRKSQGVSGKG